MTPILPRFYRRQQAEADRRNVDTAVRESTPDTPTTPRHELTKPGDPRKLRGIPCIARGVGGTSQGTDPLAELLRNDR